MSETAVKKVKKEESDDDDEIQIVHMNIRVPIVIPPEAAVHDSMAPVRQLAAATAAAAAATAAMSRRLPPGAQPSRVDKDYWTGKDESDSCPRCTEVKSTATTRLAHYKRCHYDIFYVIVRIVWMEPHDRWMAVHLGPPSGRRLCVHCMRKCGLSRSYNGRGSLAAHIEKDHPAAFHEQMRNHDSGSVQTAARATQGGSVTVAVNPASSCPVTTASPASEAPTSLALGPLPSHLSQVWPTAGGLALSKLFPTAAAAAAVAAPTSLTLCAPPLPADEAYWCGRTDQGSGRESCPRCSYDASDSKHGRSDHYKRHHYNVYYMKTRRWNGGARTPLRRWMAVHFGNQFHGARVCALCVGDASHYSGYRSRAELIRHMTQTHPLAMLDLAREYSAAWNNSSITDEEVHGLLMNALSTFE